jgi:mono/diheme cytochrome c family protein
MARAQFVHLVSLSKSLTQANVDGRHWSDTGVTNYGERGSHEALHILAACLLLGGFSAAATAAQGTEEDSLFQTYCAACHGAAPAAAGTPDEHHPP